ncbi:IAP repeat-containing protein [Callinectes sapidus nudivirus]|nr:IAP repeat-containing protein [Callinectes sapidus nudivirus]
MNNSSCQHYHPCKNDCRIRKISHNGLYSEAVRFSTFFNWKVPFVNPKDLAETGLFYIKKEDFTQCIYCNTIIAFWEKGDVPKKEHAKHEHTCPVVNNSPDWNFRNIPVSDHVQTDFYLRWLNTKPAADKEHSRMNTEESRLETYIKGKWPLSQVKTAPLAKAGFYYAGVGDAVVCFRCGGILINWIGTDIPEIDHLKYFPDCPYAHDLVFKNANINITIGMKIESPLKVTELELQQFMEHPIVQFIKTFFKFEDSNIKNMIRDELESYGTLARCTREYVLEKAFDEIEKEEKRRILASKQEEEEDIDVDVEVIEDCEELEMNNTNYPTVIVKNPNFNI